MEPPFEGTTTVNRLRAAGAVVRGIYSSDGGSVSAVVIEKHGHMYVCSANGELGPNGELDTILLWRPLRDNPMACGKQKEGDNNNGASDGLHE